jgi:hypothetical protein
MTRLTCRKYQSTANGKGNARRSSESTETRPNKSKRAAKAKNTPQPPPSTEPVLESSEEDEEDTVAHVRVRDISLDTYTLHKSVVVGDTTVVSDTDFLKFEEFDFRDFETQNIRRLNDAAKKGGFEFEHTSGTATISAKGVRVLDSIVITVEDSHSWKKVEKGIERWMLANKKEITVKLAIVYAKTGLQDTDSSEDEKPARKKVPALFSIADFRGAKQGQ